MPKGKYTRTKPLTPVKERFESKISMEPNTGCWLWTGTTNDKGYAQIRIDGIYKYAHRLSWKFNRGPIPQNLQVLHKCDTPSCVNPLHLFLGTQKDNMQDAKKKGRTPLGERNGMVKLTGEQVIKIRQDNRTHEAIAKEHMVSRAIISMIKERKRWDHINP
jgi:hypothetical protein